VLIAMSNLNPQQFEPLPMEEGLYYRTQHKDAPKFSRANATTAPIGESPHESLNKHWQPKEGYSGFWNPHHVEQYHEEMNWPLKGRKVIAFRGTAVGEGSDGEPRVVPLRPSSCRTNHTCTRARSSTT
jgi:hypothetical protein